MVIFAIIFMLLIFGVIDYYLGIRMFQCISIIFPKINKIICISIFVILTLLMILGFLRSMFTISDGIKEFLKYISSYVMGFYVYIFLFCILADLIIICINLFKFKIENIRLYSGIFILVMTLCTFIYGLVNGNNIKNVSYDIEINSKEDNLNMNIIMISDLHLGAVNSEKRLSKIVSEINSKNADLLLISGDIFDNDYYAIKNPEKVINDLSSIKTKYGVYASLGNHDSGKTFDKMLDLLNKSNIKVLMDESEIIDNKLVVFGRLDKTPIGGYKENIERSNIDEKLDYDLPIIMLEHNPMYIDEYSEKVDLILSGHTHRGQLFPANIVTDLMYEVDYGYYNNSGTHVIVSSGVGTWSMPMRVGSHCEIVNINVK